MSHPLLSISGDSPEVRKLRALIEACETARRATSEARQYGITVREQLRSVTDEAVKAWSQGKEKDALKLGDRIEAFEREVANAPRRLAGAELAESAAQGDLQRYVRDHYDALQGAHAVKATGSQARVQAMAEQTLTALSEWRQDAHVSEELARLAERHFQERVPLFGAGENLRREIGRLLESEVPAPLAAPPATYTLYEHTPGTAGDARAGFEPL